MLAISGLLFEYLIIMINVSRHAEIEINTWNLPRDRGQWYILMQLQRRPLYRKESRKSHGYSNGFSFSKQPNAIFFTQSNLNINLYFVSFLSYRWHHFKGQLKLKMFQYKSQKASSFDLVQEDIQSHCCVLR